MILKCSSLLIRVFISLQLSVSNTLATCHKFIFGVTIFFQFKIFFNFPFDRCLTLWILYCWVLHFVVIWNIFKFWLAYCYAVWGSFCPLRDFWKTFFGRSRIVFSLGPLWSLYKGMTFMRTLLNLCWYRSPILGA